MREYYYSLHKNNNNDNNFKNSLGSSGRHGRFMSAPNTTSNSGRISINNDHTKIYENGESSVGETDTSDNADNTNSVKCTNETALRKKQIQFTLKDNVFCPWTPNDGTTIRLRKQGYASSGKKVSMIISIISVLVLRNPTVLIYCNYSLHIFNYT